MFLRDLSNNEVGGFGICDTDDLLLIRDIAIVEQKVSIASVSFDDNAVADFFDTQVEAGRKPEQFARCWIHSHPDDDPHPSATDEKTFQQAFGNCDWAVMVIVARDGKTFARFRFNAGPGGDIKIPVCVDYNCAFEGTDYNLWKAEYEAKVTEERRSGKRFRSNPDTETPTEAFGFDESQVSSVIPYEDLLMELDAMDPMERQIFLEELSSHSDFWDEYEQEMGVFYE